MQAKRKNLAILIGLNKKTEADLARQLLDFLKK
jgi:hypothetical protein